MEISQLCLLMFYELSLFGNTGFKVRIYELIIVKQGLGFTPSCKVFP